MKAAQIVSKTDAISNNVERILTSTVCMFAAILEIM